MCLPYDSRTVVTLNEQVLDGLNRNLEAPLKCMHLAVGLNIYLSIYLSIYIYIYILYIYIFIKQCLP